MQDGAARNAHAGAASATPRVALLACGILYAALYPLVNDVIAATLYDGYSRLDQAVSELSAVGAPTQRFLTAVGPILSLIFIAFGIGVLRAAGPRRSLKAAGALIIAHGAMGFLWMLAPMSRREVIAASGPTPADTMHQILAGLTGLFVSAYVATAAIAFGWKFRLYSVATIAVALVFGILSGRVGNIEAGEPTPWMGLIQRTGIGAWLVWMTVLAVVLIRETRHTATQMT